MQWSPTFLAFDLLKQTFVVKPSYRLHVDLRIQIVLFELTWWYEKIYQQKATIWINKPNFVYDKSVFFFAFAVYYLTTSYNHYPYIKYI